jgi:hypothetical protein
MSPRTGPSPEFQTVWAVPGRYEDEATSCHRYLAVTQQEGCISFRDVKRLVGVRVQVQRRCGLARRKHSDNRDVGTGPLCRPKVGRLRRALRSNDRTAVHRFHRAQPMPENGIDIGEAADRLTQPDLPPRVLPLRSP